jgi:hypothetical protein
MTAHEPQGNGDILFEPFARPQDIGYPKKTFTDISKSAPRNTRSATFVDPTSRPDIVHPVVKQLDPSVPRIDGSMSQGTVAQLLSIGPQDRFLSLNPQVSFFRRVYKRHTDFAVECIEEQFSTSSFVFGSTNVCTLGKHGDLLGSMTLCITLPNLGIPGGTWVDAIGYVMLRQLRLRIGDLIVQTQERLWYDIEDSLFVTDAHSQGLDAMIGRTGTGSPLSTNASHEIYVPLKFLCCRGNSGRQQFIPVTCLDHSVNVAVEIDTESLAACVVLPAGTSLPPVTSTAATLLVDNVYVDDIERTRFATVNTELMFEVIRDIDQTSYIMTNAGNTPVTNVTVDMRELNMPVRYFTIVAYDETYETHFQYLDVIDSATFLINTDQQFEPRKGPYFSLQQPYEHFVRSETSNVYAFSFALDAGAWQPNGSLNFAVLSNPTLRIALKDVSTPLKVKVFASCINWLTFGGGGCTLRYDC